MKIAAVIILTLLTLKQALRAMLISNTKEQDKLAYILFPTTIFYLMAMGAI